MLVEEYRLWDRRSGTCIFWHQNRIMDAGVALTFINFLSSTLICAVQQMTMRELECLLRDLEHRSLRSATYAVALPEPEPRTVG